MLPTLFGIVGLVIDGGLMMNEYRNLQHAADAASTAAAMQLKLGNGTSTAVFVANEVVHTGNELSDADVTVNIPPSSGPFAGQAGHAEVIANSVYQSRLTRILDGIFNRSLQVRSVAGVEDVTQGAAIAVLDPDPADLSYPSAAEVAATVDNANVADEGVAQAGVGDLLTPVPVVGSLAASLVEAKLADLMPDTVAELVDGVVAVVPTTALPTLTAGLEIEGLGQLRVDGAIHVNNEWGGVDENGDPAGSAAGPPYAVACMPLLPTTSVTSRDIRVVGGVDNPDYYRAFDGNDPNPLQANRLPVDDPYADLPVPSAASAPGNFSGTVHDPADLVRVALPTADVTQLANSVLNLLPVLVRPLFQPLIAPLTELLTQPVIEPGVYNSITVLSPVGGARFEPGIYVIRGTNPDTHLSLCILGPVTAEGVLFYITTSANYDPATGLPDAGEDADQAPANPLLAVTPSTLIAPLLPTARISGLSAPGSPFDGLLIFQRRSDRRPIVIEAQQLLGGGDLAGSIYAKWGHTIFAAGAGSYDLRFVTGTMRVLTITNTTLAPSSLFPPAKDVLLVE